MTSLTEFSLRHRGLTLLIVALITFASIFATFRLKKELTPNIQVPQITVVTVYLGVSPEDMVTHVTMPIENALAYLDGLEHLLSTSNENVSSVTAQFVIGTNIDRAEGAISQRLARLQLPARAQPPQIVRYGTEMFPVVALSLVGNLEPKDLTQIADTQIIPKLAHLEGVSSIGTEGDIRTKLIFEPNLEQLNEYGISVSQISAILGANNLSIPAGEIKAGNQVIPVKTLHEYKSLEEIEDTIVGASLSPIKIVRLRDVGNVSLGIGPNTEITRTNGNSSIAIMAFKDPNANTVTVANRIMDEVAQIKQNLTGGAQLITVLNQSEYVERSIQSLSRDAELGALFTALIIFMFLMSVSASLIIVVSIPLSIITAFLIMYGFGLSINILTMSAMVIATGRVVDDSIVVLENIRRHLQQGKNIRAACTDAVREVAMPITLATMASIAIFLPLAFIGGIVGGLFRPFALATTFALLSSLAVALVVVPLLSNFTVIKMFRIQKKDSWYQSVYVKTIKWSLAHRILVMAVIVVLVCSSFAFWPFVGTNLLPPTGEKFLVLDLKMPPGTTLDATMAETARLEAIINTSIDSKVYLTVAGVPSELGASISNIGASLLNRGSNMARVMIALNVSADTEKEAAKLRAACKSEMTTGEIKVSTLQSILGEGNDVKIVVSGEDQDEISHVSQSVFASLTGVAGVENVESDLPSSRQLIAIDIDPLKALYYGLTTAQVGKELNDLITGQTVMQAKIEGNSYDFLIAGVADKINGTSDLNNLRVGGSSFTGSGGIGMPVALGKLPVPLNKIANITLSQGPSEIHRVNQEYVVTMTAHVTDVDVGSVRRQIQEQIDAMEIPPGIQISLAGVAQQMQESFSSMIAATIAAIAIAYIIMALTLRSLLNPLIVLVSLPLASIGALLALVITHQPLGVPALLGILMLVGIVLSNGIVLLSFVEPLRQSGMSTYDALVQAGRTRLRPILMTTLTTIICLIPLALALGEGTLIGAELAIVVIGGLLTSTILTLLVTPVIYSLIDSFRDRRPH